MDFEHIDGIDVRAAEHRCAGFLTGNAAAVAQNINVKIQDVDFGTIPFLKPGEDYLIPVAYFIHASDQKIAFAERIKVTGDTTTIPVVLTMGKTSSEFDVDITIQKNAIKLNESDSRYFEKMGKLEAIEKQQEKMTGEIKKVGENIKNKK